jgi:predicted dehydrogenase
MLPKGTTMTKREIGIILSGVTGRMGTNQHLLSSILPIMAEGGLKVGDELTVMPRPLLVGRNEDKLRRLSEMGREHVGRELDWTTDLDAALADETMEIFFDASTTTLRTEFVGRAIEAGKAIYCEKPTAEDTASALELAERAEAAGLKNGVVQDKLFLPGLVTLQGLIEEGFFGEILSVKGDFGYWVFTGLGDGPDPQRPSWNYRKAEGGGIVLDMFCHWNYVLENLFGRVEKLVTFAHTGIDRRSDENGRPYAADADDAAYAIFLLEGGVACPFSNSWYTRVRRDDLLTLQVDGTAGSAVAGLRDVYAQSLAETPRPVWNPDEPQPIDFYKTWRKIPAPTLPNAFRAQWEQFLRHVAADAPFPWDLRAGARGVQLAQVGLRSAETMQWLDVPAL